MIRTIFAATMIGALSMSSVAFAKGHSQGLGGAGLAGSLPAGFIGDLQKNTEGGKAGAYGFSDARGEAMAGERDKKEAAAEANAERKN